ncbi:Cullin-3 [Ascosphaera pollenicola]|nr:Cullin-3 [Ascosphaera pollenicola]
MNHLDGVSRTHYENPRGKESHATLRHDIEYWARKGIGRDARYHEMRPVAIRANHARVLALFYNELTKRKLVSVGGSSANYRIDDINAVLKQLKPNVVDAVVEAIRLEMLTREAWVGGAGIDPEKTTTARLLQEIEQFMNLGHTTSMGDIEVLILRELLRDQQVDVLEKFLFGTKDVLLLAATGLGKLVLLHSFSALTKKTTMIIVPLIKLAEEQNWGSKDQPNT